MRTLSLGQQLPSPNTRDAIRRKAQSFKIRTLSFARASAEKGALRAGLPLEDKEERRRADNPNRLMERDSNESKSQ